jgi:hypothetical protein
MKRLCTLFFIVSTLCAWAQRPVEVSDDINEEHFMPYELAIFVDSTNQKSFAQISSPAFAKDSAFTRTIKTRISATAFRIGSAFRSGTPQRQRKSGSWNSTIRR